MSGNKNSGNRSGRSSPAARSATVAPRSPQQKAAKRALLEKPLDKVPPPPDNPIFDKRAGVIWQRLGDRLLDYKMLSELDLETMEWVVVAWRAAELNADSRAATVPANALRVIAGLKELGLTKSGRTAGTADDDDAVEASPFTKLFGIDGGKDKPKAKDGRRTSR